MTSPLCVVRELMDWPRAAVQGRPIISGHRYAECPPEPGQACCVTVLRCETCGDYDVQWRDCTCKPRRPKLGFDRGRGLSDLAVRRVYTAPGPADLQTGVCNAAHSGDSHE